MKIPKGKRATETSAESQYYIDTGILPKEHPLTLWSYRVLDTDDDGDPLDHGVLRARGVSGAAHIVRKRLIRLGLAEYDELDVRFYPTRDRTTAGILASRGEYIDVPIKLRKAFDICECGRPWNECAARDNEDAYHGDR